MIVLLRMDPIPSESAVLYWKSADDPAFFSSSMNYVASDWWVDTIPEQATPEDSLELLYYIEATDSAGNVVVSDTLSFWIVNSLSGVEEENSLNKFSLKMPGINRGGINFSVILSYPAAFSLRVYSVDGKLVHREETTLQRGIYNFSVPVRSGVYFISVGINGRIHRKKVLVIK